MTYTSAVAVAAALAGQPAQPEAAPPPSAAPAPAAAPEPAPAPAPAPASAEAQPAPAPATSPPPPSAATPPPAAAPPPAEESDDDDDDEEDEEPVERRGLGNGLLIAAGATGAVGIIFNALRVYTVTVPCQTDTQDGCSSPWVTETIFAWTFNSASIALAAAGGRIRGKNDANFDRAAHRRRKPGTIIAGAVLMSVGAITNMVLRSVWLYDYTSPQGPEAFDFAYIGHSAAYYGGLQASSMAFAAGAGALMYGTASPDRRRVSFGPTPLGFSIEGRF